MNEEEKKEEIPTNRIYNKKIILIICGIAIVVIIGVIAALITTINSSRGNTGDSLRQVGRQDTQSVPGAALQERIDGIPADWHGVWYPNFLPEGFSLDTATAASNIKSITFTDDDGNTIQFQQWSMEESQVYMESQGDQATEVKIKGQYDGYWSEKDGETTLIWLQQDNIMIMIAKLEIADIKKIAESLKYIK